MFLDAGNISSLLDTPADGSIRLTLPTPSTAARYQVHGDQALSQSQSGVPSQVVAGVLTGADRQQLIEPIDHNCGGAGSSTNSRRPCAITILTIAALDHNNLRARVRTRHDALKLYFQ